MFNMVTILTAVYMVTNSYLLGFGILLNPKFRFKKKIGTKNVSVDAPKKYNKNNIEQKN